jgi:hypothetical protein
MWVPSGSGLLLDRLACGLVFLPHGDHHERQEHGVDHPQSYVDEAGHVVMSLAREGGHEAMHQLEPYERDQANSTDHQDAVNYRVQHSDALPLVDPTRADI